MNNIYVRLAKTNIQNNRQLYLPYIISGIVTVMMFYPVSYTHLHKENNYLFFRTGNEEDDTIECCIKAVSYPHLVASIVLADGPAGLRLRSEYQVREDGSIDGGDFLDGFENGYFAEPKESKGIVYHQYCTARCV